MSEFVDADIIKLLRVDEKKLEAEHDGFRFPVARTPAGASHFQCQFLELFGNPVFAEGVEPIDERLVLIFFQEGPEFLSCLGF